MTYYFYYHLLKPIICHSHLLFLNLHIFVYKALLIFFVYFPFLFLMEHQKVNPFPLFYFLLQLAHYIHFESHYLLLIKVKDLIHLLYLNIDEVFSHISQHSLLLHLSIQKYIFLLVTLFWFHLEIQFLLIILLFLLTF